MEPTQLPGNDQLLDEAIQWLTKLDTGILSAEENEEFINWVNTSDEHRRAYQEMSDVWQLTASLQTIPSLQKEADELLSQPSQENLRSERQPATHPWLMVAASLLVVASVLLSQLLPTAQTIETPQLYASAIGQITKVKLEDGSSLTLNTNTRVEVFFSEDQRSIKLLQGETLFEVAKDKQRPFIVDVGNGFVRAVGTAFNIKKQPDFTVVTITEGIVSIKNNQGETKSVKAIENEQVTIQKHQTVREKKTDVSQTIAWTNRQLIYTDEPIQKVINDLNTYLAQPAEIINPTINQLRVSGTLNIDNPSQALNVLLTSYDLKAESDGSTLNITRQ